jgi:hypothetical protein
MKNEQFTALRLSAAGGALSASNGRHFIDRLGTAIGLPMATRWWARGVDARG